MMRFGKRHHLLIAVVAFLFGAGGMYVAVELRENLRLSEIALPLPEAAENHELAVEVALADLLRGMEQASAASGAYGDHHMISRLANGLYFTEDESDMCVEQEIRCATSAAIQLYVSNYHELELAWWQSRSSLRRIIILSVFFTQMNPRICCFPAFSCRSFAPEIAAQRHREIEWVAAHRGELYPVIKRLVNEQKTVPSSQE